LVLSKTINISLFSISLIFLLYQSTHQIYSNSHLFLSSLTLSRLFLSSYFLSITKHSLKVNLIKIFFEECTRLLKTKKNINQPEKTASLQVASEKRSLGLSVCSFYSVRKLTNRDNRTEPNQKSQFQNPNFTKPFSDLSIHGFLQAHAFFRFNQFRSTTFITIFQISFHHNQFPPYFRQFNFPQRSTFSRRRRRYSQNRR
jgi:hypothetical protein